MYRHFAGCLGQVLAVKGWRAKRLAMEVGVHKSTVSRWLNGETEPRNLTELVAIADALNVSTDELLGRKPSPGLSIDQMIRQLPVDLQNIWIKRLEDERNYLQQLLEDYRKA